MRLTSLALWLALCAAACSGARADVYMYPNDSDGDNNGRVEFWRNFFAYVELKEGSITVTQSGNNKTWENPQCKVLNATPNLFSADVRWDIWGKDATDHMWYHPYTSPWTTLHDILPETTHTHIWQITRTYSNVEEWYSHIEAKEAGASGSAEWIKTNSIEDP